jgi:hypothetical protein
VPVGSPWTASLAGAGGAAATAAFYAVGSSRAFSWDASNTVANFVATPSLLDPFSRQASFNNHVLFSALDHLVYTATGSQDERLLRALPIAVAAGVVGLLCWALTRRLGILAGVAAGAVVAANPLSIHDFREVRGYSLLVLCALVSTVLLWRLLQEPASPGRLVVAYCIVVALGVATHLLMLGVLFVHVAVVASGWAPLRRWLPRWLAGAALGLGLAAVPIGKALMHHHHRTPHPRFPLQLTYDLLGGVPVALVALLPVVALGLWLLRRRAPVQRALLAAALVIAGAWALSPEFLPSRYFLWLLPGVAVVAAVAVARWPLLAGLVALAVGAQVVSHAPGLGEDQVPNRIAAELVSRAQQQGLRTCAIRSTATTIAAYATGFTKIRSPDQLTSCDLVVVAEGQAPYDAALVAAASRTFPHVVRLPAHEPGLAFYSGAGFIAAGQR